MLAISYMGRNYAKLISGVNPEIDLEYESLIIHEYHYLCSETGVGMFLELNLSYINSPHVIQYKGKNLCERLGHRLKPLGWNIQMCKYDLLNIILLMVLYQAYNN